MVGAIILTLDVDHFLELLRHIAAVSLKTLQDIAARCNVDASIGADLLLDEVDGLHIVWVIHREVNEPIRVDLEYDGIILAGDPLGDAHEDIGGDISRIGLDIRDVSVGSVELGESTLVDKVILQDNILQPQIRRRSLTHQWLELLAGRSATALEEFDDSRIRYMHSTYA